MKQHILKSVLIACLAPLAGFFLMSAAQAQPPSPVSSPHMSHGAMQDREGVPHDMKQSMMNGMEGMHKMVMTGDVDKDFAMMMKMHHQQGVKMAQMELSHGKSSAMKAMAKKIIAAQNKEITQLDNWLAKQK
jgi:uncharacterized protein (DUF305 family)